MDDKDFVKMVQARERETDKVVTSGFTRREYAELGFLEASLGVLGWLCVAAVIMGVIAAPFTNGSGLLLSLAAVVAAVLPFGMAALIRLLSDIQANTQKTAYYVELAAKRRKESK